MSSEQTTLIPDERGETYATNGPADGYSGHASELIALGQVITHYIAYLERQPNPTREQLECVALLRSFQGRVVARIYPPKEGQR